MRSRLRTWGDQDFSEAIGFALSVCDSKGLAQAAKGRQ
jgi:hypothetical protein